ncbi:hypothetical protein BN1180_00920 [Peribacillus simplex]|uniref:Uncharacterized protein n=1 Tax=Peribacillus simplex TaxID=1478 RepID=A0AAN2PE51_9BACI|nr:hypothetical protein BN1180_00920 [Peribacillus simplex]
MHYSMENLKIIGLHTEGKWTEMIMNVKGGSPVSYWAFIYIYIFRYTK